MRRINDHFEKDAVFAVTESDKMANEICLPVAGTIIEINTSLLDDPITSKPKYRTENKLPQRQLRHSVFSFRKSLCKLIF